jgi:hypothetical protein
MKVYLCGAIAGCSDTECKDWREVAKKVLPDTLDPMVRDYRGKEDSNTKDIVELDKRDIDNSDALLVNYIKPSVGTSMEILYAWERGKIVVIVAAPGTVLSPWLKYHCLAVAPTFQQAFHLLRHLDLTHKPQIPMRGTYKGYITKLSKNEVFVFGSNLDGFHGAGSAGYASFGVAGNHWREYRYDEKPAGWCGKWNVKGCAEGFQCGTEACSYALPTVTKAGAKRSLSINQIKLNISKFYDWARSHPQTNFLVAQENKMGLNGYTPEEMAEAFSSAAIPENVIFEEKFAKLLKYETTSPR